MSREYKPTGLAETIFKERYTIHPEETWEEASSRLAKHVSSAEINGKREPTAIDFYEQIVTNKFMPGGRIWYGSGRPRAQLLNCFVVPTHDSREGWGKTISDVIVVSGMGGGVGINLSPIRPRGSRINGTGGVATGAVSLMQMINGVGDVLVSGGGRRLALMLDLNITHPDMPEFLDKKLDHDELKNANVSIVLDKRVGTKTLIDKVKSGGSFDLTFSGNHYGKVNAKDIWNRIAFNAWKSGEPGVLNGDLANKENNIFYYKPMISTNPCLTGDTQIMTLDGPRTFASLAESGRDILVYAWHPKTKVPVVRWMRSPRLTRRNAEILEVEFDSGLKIRCTPDHNFFSFRGKKVQAQNLRIGQSVRAWSMSQHRDGHLRVHGWDSEKNLANHQWVARMVYENAYGNIPEGMIVHHKDENKVNNNLDNLELLENNSEHNKVHYQDRFLAGFDGKARNHKVIGIRSAGFENVYNGTVDDAHSYIVVDPEPVAGIASGIVSANCGEIWLEEYGSCDLGAIVLPRFISGDGIFDWDALRDTITVAVRFLDNVLSVNEYPLPEIRENNNSVRRLGLGIMGLHSALIQLGYRYSSDSAQAFVDTLMGFIKEESYKASIDLSIEKGPFPAYDEAMLQSGFMKRAISNEIKSSIRHHGIRNCALLTIAPTGTTGMVSNVSTGIEPLFAPAYWRRFYRPTSDGSRQLDKELVVDPLWGQLEHDGKDVSVLEGAYDISPEGHFQMQTICQKHIDNATSKTINLAADYPVDSLADLWLEYLPQVKGTTFYRAGSRGEEPLEAIPLDEARRLLQAKHVHADANINEQNMMDCVGDSCGIPDELKPQILEAPIAWLKTY